MNQVKNLHCSEQSPFITALCFGCGKEIKDKHVLLVQPDLYWHGACLKCTECCQILDETCTCYVRHNKAYCKSDYLRIFTPKCAKCDVALTKTDLVMKHNSSTYHTDCFQCSVCHKTLLPGNEFCFENNNLLCKQHFNNNRPNNLAFNDDSTVNLSPTFNCEIPEKSDLILKLTTTTTTTTTPTTIDRNSKDGSGRINKANKSVALKKDKSTKSTRIRTVLNEKQLQMLRACYSANPRPDALLKEQLVEMTGLSPRVIRVWFQNKRCKDKKRQIAVKQFQHQQHPTERVNVSSFNGFLNSEVSTVENCDSIGLSNSSCNNQQSLKNLHTPQQHQNWKTNAPFNYQNCTSIFFNSQTSSSTDTTNTGSFSGDLIFHPQELSNEFSTYNYSPSCLIYRHSLSYDEDFYSSSPHLVGSDLSSPSCSDRPLIKRQFDRDLTRAQSFKLLKPIGIDRRMGQITDFLDSCRDCPWKHRLEDVLWMLVGADLNNFSCAYLRYKAHTLYEIRFNRVIVSGYCMVNILAKDGLLIN